MSHANEKGMRSYVHMDWFKQVERERDELLEEVIAMRDKVISYDLDRAGIEERAKLDAELMECRDALRDAVARESHLRARVVGAEAERDELARKLGSAEDELRGERIARERTAKTRNRYAHENEELARKVAELGVSERRAVAIRESVEGELLAVVHELQKACPEGEEPVGMTRFIVSRVAELEAAADWLRSDIGEIQSYHDMYGSEALAALFALVPERKDTGK